MTDKQEDTEGPPEGEKTPNPYDNSRPLDVHRSSDFPEVGAAVDSLYGELSRLPGFSENESYNKRHIRVVVTDLFHVHNVDPEAYVGYSRNSNSYGPKSRYSKLRIKYLPLIRVIDGLIALGYAEGPKGFQDRRTGKSRQSRMRATLKLAELLRDTHKVEPRMVSRVAETESIILRDSDKKDAPFKDTPRTRKMRAVVDRYNDVLRRTYSDLSLRGYKGQKRLRIDLNRNQVHRVFNNGSFKQGGRFHGGWWQNIPRELRTRNTIQDKPTVEVDYSAMHIVILYALEGVDYFAENDGDPYLIDGFPNDDKHRALLKLILLTCLNASSKKSAKLAIRDEVRKNPDNFPKEVDLDAAIAEFETKHAPIAKHFYSGVGLDLQYYDSLVAERVIEYFTHEGSIGIAPLVVHDSFIVRRGLQDELERVMDDALKDVLKNEIGGKAAVVTSRLKTKIWDMHDTGEWVSADEEDELLNSLRTWNESEVNDQEQERRRSEWNESGWYPVAVYEPPTDGDEDD